MRANDFIKKFGWERVKHCKKSSSRDNFFIVGGEVIRDQDLIDLKRIVESYELIELLDDIEEAKELLDLDGLRGSTILRLKQAILDVENCKQ